MEAQVIDLKSSPRWPKAQKMSGVKSHLSRALMSSSLDLDLSKVLVDT